MTFKNKVIIVTGAAGGIGLATAKAFAAAEGKVVLVDIDLEKLKTASRSILAKGKGEICCLACNVAKEEEVKEVYSKALKKYGDVHIVVNNAGLMLFKPIEEQTIKDWQKIFNVDLYGAFFFIKQAFLNMKPGGAIVNVSSIHAEETEPMVAPYAAAKAALLSLTRSAAIEAKPKGIRVNAILPGAIDTPMLWDNPNVKAGIEVIDKADVGRAEDVADVILYLSSQQAKFVQGACLRVDGGRLNRL
jgi:NAD(P)-dependent dehydrogenase (short-subunit alcohol dehydrogenase family)